MALNDKTETKAGSSPLDGVRGDATPAITAGGSEGAAGAPLSSAEFTTFEDRLVRDANRQGISLDMESIRKRVPKEILLRERRSFARESGLLCEQMERKKTEFLTAADLSAEEKLDARRALGRFDRFISLMHSDLFHWLRDPEKQIEKMRNFLDRTSPRDINMILACCPIIGKGENVVIDNVYREGFRNVCLALQPESRADYFL